MKFDLRVLAERLRVAADRSASMTVEVTATDLVFSKDGHGTNGSESVPFAALFLREADVVGDALNRLERRP